MYDKITAKKTTPFTSFTNERFRRLTLLKSVYDELNSVPSTAPGHAESVLTKVYDEGKKDTEVGANAAIVLIDAFITGFDTDKWDLEKTFNKAPAAVIAVNVASNQPQIASKLDLPQVHQSPLVGTKVPTGKPKSDDFAEEEGNLFKLAACPSTTSKCGRTMVNL